MTPVSLSNSRAKVIDSYLSSKPPSLSALVGPGDNTMIKGLVMFYTDVFGARVIRLSCGSVFNPPVDPSFGSGCALC